MTTPLEDLVSGDLHVKVEASDTHLALVWLGKSTDREPSVLLGPFLERAIGSLASRSFELDFRSLEYMNSSTLVPITRAVRAAAVAKIPLLVRFRPSAPSQRAPFEMLARLVGRASSVSFAPG